MDFACRVFIAIFPRHQLVGKEMYNLFILLPCVQVEEDRTRIGKIRLRLFNRVVCI